MLLNLLRSLWRAPPPAQDAHAEAARLQEMVRLAKLAAEAPLEAHLAILFRDVQLAGLPLDALVRECLAETGAQVPPVKAVHRRLASLFLAQYFLHALSLPGRRAECGVFTGTSARILCRAARARDPSYDGSGLHLVDSFEGLPEGGREDRIAGLAEDAVPAQARAGALASPLETARRSLADFPGVALHKGWIPAVFGELPEDAWSFVHVDVDLYAPTQAALAYFWPRLAPGGVIVCDDYGSALFPGARRAWDEFCEEAGLAFIALPTGQSVLVKAGG